MKKTTTNLILLIISSFIILIPFIALAENEGETSKPQTKGVQMDESFRPSYAVNIINTNENRASMGNEILQMISGGLIYMAGPIAILMIAVGGLQYVLSAGDQTKIEGSKKTVTWAIIGLLVIILSWAIVTNVMQIAIQGGTVGVDSKNTEYYTEEKNNEANGETEGGSEETEDGSRLNKRNIEK